MPYLRKLLAEEFGLAASVSLIALLLVACQSTSPSGDASPGRVSSKGAYELPANRDARSVLGSLAATNQAESAVWFENSLADYLPNQLLSVNGQKASRRSAGVVFGTVSAVKPGRGFYVENVEPEGAAPDADHGTETSFDDPRAAWRVAEVTVQIDASVGLEDKPESVRFGAVITGSDADAAMRGLKELGSVVVVLGAEGEYAWDKELFAVARSGSLLGDIDQNGHLGFPALAEGSGPFVGKLDSKAAVLAEAEKSKPIIQVRVVDGVPQRN